MRSPSQRKSSQWSRDLAWDRCRWQHKRQRIKDKSYHNPLLDLNCTYLITQTTYNLLLSSSPPHVTAASVTMDPPNSFPQFNHFPLELRRLVWKCCLPRRIAEEDFPFTLLDGKESRQACWPVRTTLQNARVPLLALVCREAREVVFEWGGHQISYDKTSLRSIWVQPKIDRALHINW